MSDEEKKEETSFGAVVATIGAVLTAVGIAWLIANNWNVFPAFLKIILLLAFTVSSFVIGIVLRTHGYSGIGKSLLILGALLYTWSIFLIAQIFSTDSSLQGMAILLLLAWVGVLVTAYIFNSSANVLIALVEFFFWIHYQYLALIERFGYSDFSPGNFMLIYLFLGTLLYGIYLLHVSSEHRFANLYRWWTVFYLLGFAYLLSFQTVLPMLWSEGLSTHQGSIVFLIATALIAAVIFVTGSVIGISKKVVPLNEVLAVLGIGVLLLIVILSGFWVSSTLGTCSMKTCYELKTQSACTTSQIKNSACVWDSGVQGYCSELTCYNFQNETSCADSPTALKCAWTNDTYSTYCRSNLTYESNVDSNGVYNPYGVCGDYQNNRVACTSKSECSWNKGGYFNIWGGNSGFASAKIVILWIFANMVFLALILAVIGYGSYYRDEKIVNLGIAAFVLEILTRYIGFMMDLAGYRFILPMVFITGGILLIGGGWIIEKWRRKIVARIRESRPEDST